MISVHLTRRYQLSALHSLENPHLSDDENFKIFGPCFRLHGHDYGIEITIEGMPDPDTGLVIERDKLDEIVKRNLLERLGGQNLNDFFPRTTGEALALAFFDKLQPCFPATCKLVRVRIRETAKNFFDAIRAG